MVTPRAGSGQAEGVRAGGRHGDGPANLAPDRRPRDANKFAVQWSFDQLTSGRLSTKMAEDELDRAIQSMRDDLRLEDELKLSGAVRRLEERFSGNLRAERLWLMLIRESVHSSNVQLAKLTAAKLGLNLLSILIKQAANGLSQSEDQKMSIFRYVKNYLQLGDDTNEITANRDSDTICGHYRSLRLCFERGQWAQAASFVNCNIKSLDQKDLMMRLVHYERAKQEEIQEAFEESLAHYEKSGSHYENLPRLVMKHLMGSANQALQEYCSASEDMKRFWAKFQESSRNYHAALDTYESLNDNLAKLRCSALTGSISLLETTIMASLPAKVREFIEDTNWDMRVLAKSASLVVSICADLDPSTRCLLAELASYHMRQNNLLRSSRLQLCLAQSESSLELSRPLLNKFDALYLVALLGSNENLASDLVRLMTESGASQISVKPMREAQILFFACLKLGLIDEALQVFAKDSSRNEMDLTEASQEIQRLIDDRHSGSLGAINPELSGSTISSIHQSLNNENDKDLTTQVITVVILSITAFLMKLDANEVGSLEHEIPKLEIMFERLAEYFNELTFNASETVVRAANSLIVAVKGKLDAIADSDIIRESFRQLIETSAGRCMIEGRYKSAAMLYSQIEDNVNAVKSLMRTGEVETVINYALLVRDITVSRITINYLKHLGTDVSTIEDFVARSKV